MSKKITLTEIPKTAPRVVVSRLSVEVGGAELSAVDHAIVLHKLGYQVHFFTNNRHLCSRLIYNKLPVHKLWWIHSSPLKPFSLPLLGVTNLLRVFFFLIRYRPHIVNPHSRDDQILFTLLKPLFGYRVIWKDAGDMRDQLRKERIETFSKLYQRIYTLAIRRSDGIYFLNDDDIKQASILVPDIKDKSIVINSDILFSSYKIHAKEKRNTLVIGTVIRLVEEKGTRILLEAFVKLGEMSVELWIVGDGEERIGLEQKAKELGISEKITFWGYQEDPSYHYSNFDIFVQPAFYEAWGRNIKEAKYFGLPIIGANTGGIAKQIIDDKTGILFTAGDAEDLAVKLKKLLKDEALRKRLGFNAQKAAQNENDFSTLMKERIVPYLFGEIGEK